MNGFGEVRIERMSSKHFEPQEYVLGPAYNLGAPIWRYRKTLRSEDGEIRHLLEMPGNPEHEVVAKNDEVQSIAGRRFFSYGTAVYHKTDDCVIPRYLCDTCCGLRGTNETDKKVAIRVAEFLEAGGEALSREFAAMMP